MVQLQSLLEQHAPESKVLAASFKTPRRALDCLLAGCEAITLPLDVRNKCSARGGRVSNREVRAGLEKRVW